MVDLSLAVSSKQGKKQRYEFMRESIISGFKYLKESKKKKINNWICQTNKIINTQVRVAELHYKSI